MVIKKLKKIAFYTIALIITIAAAMSSQAAIDDGIQVYYNFTETSGNAIDSTNYSRDTTLANVIGYGADGVLGTAFAFDGASTNLNRTNHGIPFATELTVNFWLYSNQTPPAQETLFEITDTVDENNNFIELMHNTDGGLYARSYLGGAAKFVLDSSENLANGAYYMITLRLNGTNATYFLNGTELNSQTETNTWVTMADNMFIGQFHQDSKWTEGAIDEFGFWNRSLTQSEITSLYNSGAGFYPLGGAPSTDPVRLNITASWNGNQIQSFNATVNGTLFLTDNGTVETQLAVNASSIFSTSVGGWGFISNTSTDINLSTSPYDVAIQPYYYNCNETRNDTYHLPGWLQSINPVCILNNFNRTLNGSIFVHNYNESVNLSANDTGVAIPLHWLNDNVYAWWGAVDPYGYRQDILGMDITYGFFMNLTLNAIDYLNRNISDVTWYFPQFDDTYTQNPIRHYYFSQFAGLENKTQALWVNLTDNGLVSRAGNYSFTINENQSFYNITMDPNQLFLNFSRWGTGFNTTGFLADEEKRWDFNNQTVIIVQENLTNGHVHVKFNFINDSQLLNWTQYYEYIKTNGSHVSENLEVLESPDWYSYFRVLDYGNTPLEDVIIRAEFANASPNAWSYIKLFGQRLTDREGYTFFWLDQNSEVKFTVMKDGYDPEIVLMAPGDEDFSKAEAFEVRLRESTGTGVQSSAWMYLRRDFDNRNLSINGTIVAIGRTLVEVTTDYRNTQGLPRIDISDTLETSMSRYHFQLTSGTDFNLTGTSDIQLFIYLDGTLWRELTMDYDNEQKTHAFAFTIDDTAIWNPILWIALILVSAGVELAFRKHNIGYNTFMVGSVLISFVATQFLWLSSIIMLKYGLEYAQKIWSE